MGSVQELPQAAIFAFKMGIKRSQPAAVPAVGMSVYQNVVRNPT